MGLFYSSLVSGVFCAQNPSVYFWVIISPVQTPHTKSTGTQKRGRPVSLTPPPLSQVQRSALGLRPGAGRRGGGGTGALLAAVQPDLLQGAGPQGGAAQPALQRHTGRTELQQVSLHVVYSERPHGPHTWRDVYVTHDGVQNKHSAADSGRMQRIDLPF